MFPFPELIVALTQRPVEIIAYTREAAAHVVARKADMADVAAVADGTSSTPSNRCKRVVPNMLLDDNGRNENRCKSDDLSCFYRSSLELESCRLDDVVEEILTASLVFELAEKRQGSLCVSSRCRVC